MARFEVPEAWVAQAYRFALDPTPCQKRALASHAGGGRFAHNHMCEHCGFMIDRDLNAAINRARLGETHILGEQSPTDSGSVAGRGATRETEPAQAGDAGGCEASTPHNPDRVDQTGTAVSQGTAA